MQNAEEADLRAQMIGVASDFEKGLGTGAKQKIVDDLLVLQSQRRQFTGQREDHMHVAASEEVRGGAPRASGRERLA